MPTPLSGRNPNHSPGAASTQLAGAIWLFGVIGIALLTMNLNAATRMYTWPWVMFWQALLLFPPLAWSVRLILVGNFPRLGIVSDIGLLLYAISTMVSAWLSPYRETSMIAALIPVSAICFTYLVRSWLGENPAVIRTRSRDAIAAFVVFAGVFGVVSHVYWIAFDLLPARQHGVALAQALTIRNAQPLGHSLYTAGFALIALPLSVGLATTSRGTWRIIAGATAAMSAALIVESSSRGGVLGLLAMMAAGVAVVLVRSNLSRVTKAGIALAMIATAAIFVGLNPRLRELVVHHEWSPVSAESNRQRHAMFEAGIMMGRERPLAGFGPGTVSTVYPKFRARLDGGVDDVLQLHNTPVQIWAENGAPGLLAALLVVIGAGAMVVRMLRAPTPGSIDVQHDRLRAWSVALALVAYGTFSVTDYQLDLPVFAISLSLCITLLSACQITLSDRTPAMWTPTVVRMVPAVLILGAVAVIAWYSVGDLRARHVFVTGVEALESGDAAAFERDAQRAIDLAPHSAFYPTQLALYFSTLDPRLKNPAAVPAVAHQAIEQFERAIANDPDQEVDHFNLAWLLLDSDPRAAAHQFREAARLVPDKGGVYFGLGLALVKGGRGSEAPSAYALEWINDPVSITAPAWENLLSRERRDATAAVCDRVLGSLAEDSRLTQATRDRARYVRALFQWWLQPTADHADAAAAREGDGAGFFHTLAKKVAFYDDGAAWQMLYHAWESSDPGVMLPGADPAVLAALQLRIAEHRDSFADFVTAPVVSTPFLARYRRERIAYGMLMHNSDNLRFKDLYVVEENIFATRFLREVFPPKGWLPGPVLMELLRDVATPPATP